MVIFRIWFSAISKDFFRRILFINQDDLINLSGCLSSKNVSRHNVSSMILYFCNAKGNCSYGIFATEVCCLFFLYLEVPINFNNFINIFF